MFNTFKGVEFNFNQCISKRNKAKQYNILQYSQVNKKKTIQLFC